MEGSERRPADRGSLTKSAPRSLPALAWGCGLYTARRSRHLTARVAPVLVAAVRRLWAAAAPSHQGRTATALRLEVPITAPNRDSRKARRSPVVLFGLGPKLRGHLQLLSVLSGAEISERGALPPRSKKALGYRGVIPVARAAKSGQSQRQVYGGNCQASEYSCQRPPTTGQTPDRDCQTTDVRCQMFRPNCQTTTVDCDDAGASCQTPSAHC